MIAPATFICDLFASTRSIETGIISLGVNPAARKPVTDQKTKLGSRIGQCSDGSLCDYGAATSEGLIVRSIHRHWQFHLRLIQEAGTAPLPLSDDVVGEARSRDGLDHGDDVCGVGDAGVTAGCPHMRRLPMTHARIGTHV